MYLYIDNDSVVLQEFSAELESIYKLNGSAILSEDSSTWIFGAGAGKLILLIFKLIEFIVKIKCRMFSFISKGILCVVTHLHWMIYYFYTLYTVNNEWHGKLKTGQSSN